MAWLEVSVVSTVPKFQKYEFALTDWLLNCIGVFVQTGVDVNAATGGAPTDTGILIVLTHPELDVTVSVTVYEPEAENVCVGLCVVLVLLPPDGGSPKFQLQLAIVFGLVTVERSVNVTVVFVQFALDEKLAVGIGFTVTTCVMYDGQGVVCAVNVTV